MEPGQTYHIFNHANGGENLFRDEENYRFFLQQYNKYLENAVDTYAYSLMPNHFHFLVGVRSENRLRSTFPKFETLEKLVTRQFANFFSSYTQAFNKVYQRRGSLFIKNFKRTPILSEQQWQETFLYIHFNPVKHGFVKTHTIWKWTSWREYQNSSRPSRLNREYFLNFFDDWEQVENLMEAKIEWLINKDLESI
ncbi:transposase [Cyclobacterium sp.]|uniref:transposase n=1 Tax=Cyclobacterium sp. TaxID=1966343 RepID=UPI0019AFB464|nr:transposase [Cyclobacterium sp.]MBD3630294.1 transposase [Cyclobacterium sp.]